MTRRNALQGPRKPRGALGRTWLMLILGGALASACTHNSEIDPSRSHMLRPTDPPPMVNPINLPPSAIDIQVSPGAFGGDQEEVYTISVTDMSVRDLLFALARDADMNIDVYPGITGRVTLSAIDQTLPQILDRVAKQVDLRYEIRDGVIVISPDRPYMKVYQVDYVNMERSTESSMRISTQLSTGVSGDGANPLADGDNNQSETQLVNNSQNRFWQSLTANIQAILDHDDLGNGSQSMPSGGGDGLGGLGGDLGALPGLPGALEASEGGMPTQRGGAIVSVNREAGLLSVFASAESHQQIQNLLDSVLENVHRQVLIESTVVEVELSDRYQAGVDWVNLTNTAAGFIAGSGNLVTNTINLAAQSSQRPTSFSNLPFFSLPFSKTWNSGGGTTTTVQATVQALNQFGNVRVLSSPKIMALNNQTAILKVVENKIFFTLDATASSVDTGGTTNNSPLYNTQIHTVPVGLVMSVTPQISDQDVVSMNVRPTISSISRWVNDPNPGLVSGNLLTGVGATNPIPEIRVREMESMLRVHSGQVAVMGGLMQDKRDNNTTGVPLLQDLPLIGNLFRFTDDAVTKTELVIFLRPIVMTHGRPREQAGFNPVSGSGRLQAQGPIQTPIQHRVTPGLPPVGAGNAPRVSAGPVQSAPLPPAQGGGSSYLDFTQPNAGGGYIAPPPPRAPVAPAPAAMQQAPQAAPPSLAPASPVPQQPAAPAPAAQAPAQPAPQAPVAFAPSAPTPPPPAASAVPAAAVQAPTPSGGDFFVDLGSYQEQRNADEVFERLAGAGLPAYRETAEVGGRVYQRVRSGPFPTQDEAERAQQIIVSRTGLPARVTAF